MQFLDKFYVSKAYFLINNTLIFMRNIRLKYNLQAKVE